MAIDHWHLTQKVLQSSSKSAGGSPMAIDDLYNYDRQNTPGQFKGSPMSIDIP